MALRIAFTGTGWASKVHAKAARDVPDVELAAVVNHHPISRESFAAQYGILGQYSTVSELLANTAVDALIVSTPNYLHAPESIAALQAGVHVMVEKPMAMNAAEAQRMVAAAEQGDARLMVAHCYRFDPEVRWLQSQVEDDKLGMIIRTTGYGVHVGWGPSGWFTQKELAGGGALVDMGIHALDTARFVLGNPKPRSVRARIGTYYKDLTVDDTGVILVEWESGATSYIESGWWQPHAEGICASTLVYGTRGWGRVFPTGLELTVEGSKPNEPIASGFSPRRIEDDFEAMYRSQMAYFLDCIRTGKTPDPSPQDSLINMRILDAAFQSSSTGEVVKID